jgi:hypothetical protein
MVQKRNTTLYKGLHGSSARVRKAHGTKLVAIVIRQPGNRPARAEHKHNREQSYNEIFCPSIRQRTNFIE